jgi:enoyl-CoA hydratase/carnithine racemase
MTDSVDFREEDGIGWLVLRRPETRNAVDADFVWQAIDLLGDLPAGLGALVVAGEGPAFCVGAELKQFHAAVAAGRRSLVRSSSSRIRTVSTASTAWSRWRSAATRSASGSRETATSLIS